MEAPRLCSTKLEESATIVAYNVTHTCMVTYAESTRSMRSWSRQLPRKEWEETFCWQLRDDHLEKSDTYDDNVKDSGIHEDLNVSCMALAAPEFGNVICIGTIEGTVCFWAEAPGEGAWRCKAKIRASKKPATSVSFAPSSHGPLVAVAFADGCVRFFLATEPMDALIWDLHSEIRIGTTEEVPITSLSWRRGSSEDAMPMLLCLGDISGNSSVWIFREKYLAWEKAADIPKYGKNEVAIVQQETYPVTYIAWAPSIGRPYDIIAVALDRNVILWKLEGPANMPVCTQLAVLEHDHRVWLLDWNWSGTWLGASTEGCEIWMWRPDLTGAWACQNKIRGKAVNNELQ